MSAGHSKDLERKEFADLDFTEIPGLNKGKRLTPLDRHRELNPWQRARELTRCSLYWMPVKSFPMSPAEKRWFFAFQDRLVEHICKPAGLRPETFLHMKALLPQELFTTFAKNAPDLKPLTGLARRPGAKIPAVPDPDDVRAIAEGKQSFNFSESTPDYCYWFLNKDFAKARELFAGYGGMTSGFLKPDSKTAPPELPISPGLRKKSQILRMFDMDELVASTFALRDGFLSKSKELFGVGLENQAGYPGIPFILPLLTSSDFFSQPDTECEKWFQLFDVYIMESPTDQGILLASKVDIEEALIGLLKGMAEEDLVYG